MARGKRDPRLAPLREIVGSYTENDGRTYNRLACGHSAPVTDTEGQGKRQRCNTCRHEILTGKRDA